MTANFNTKMVKKNFMKNKIWSQQNNQMRSLEIPIDSQLHLESESVPIVPNQNNDKFN